MLVSELFSKILGKRKEVEHEPWPVYYRRRLNDVDLETYLSIKLKTRGTTIESVIEFTSPTARVLEAGCGTSVLSIILSRKGYSNYCLDFDPEMIEIARDLNTRARTSIYYSLGNLFDLPFEDKTFGTVFSHGVLEHFNDVEIALAIDEGLRVAQTYVFSIPTVFNRADDLHGDENPWSF